MNNSTYPNKPQEAIFVPVQKCPYHVTFDPDLDLEHTVDADVPGDHRVQVWSRSGHLPARRSDVHVQLYIMYIVTNRLQYFAPASGRSNKNSNYIDVWDKNKNKIHCIPFRDKMDKKTYTNCTVRIGASAKSEMHSTLISCCFCSPPSTTGSTGFTCTVSCALLRSRITPIHFIQCRHQYWTYIVKFNINLI